ncbi:hypothetical protein [Tenacibaculum geojense]|uniref:Rod shape-determining protein MreD n=1 Tax=Tenacibaculum geojense TaxID=915352 RepID=A0ABW3JT35_9FLAO
MNKTLYHIILFFSLILLQALILNNILLFGYVNPYLYIVFIFLFPLRKNRFPFLTYAFLLGLFVDFFSDSGGIHTLATLTIAYLRPYFFRVAFQKTESDYEFFKLDQENFGKIFNYIVSLTLIHHFILFSFINFSFQNFSKVIVNTLLSGIFTLLLYFLGTFIFRRKI